MEPAARKTLHQSLRQALQHHHLLTLTSKPDQGKVFEASSRSAASHHFIRAGQFTRFGDWRLVYRARLNVLPLRGSISVAGVDTRCRICGYPKEKPAHVLNHCMKHSVASNNRHRAVLKPWGQDQIYALRSLFPALVVWTSRIACCLTSNTRRQSMLI